MLNQLGGPVRLPPHERADVGAQNRHMIEQLRIAARCATQLVGRGFTVLLVHCEGRQPVVWVQNSVACAQLDGVEIVRRIGPRGREQIMAAPFEGCQVQWRVCGH